MGQEPDRRRLEQGDLLVPRSLATITGRSISVPDPERPVHLQLRRFAGCPICSLHLRSVAERHDEIAAAGVQEVVVFHSPREEFLGIESELPFDVVADPERRLYSELGVERSARAVLDPRAWRAIGRGLSHTVRAVAKKEQPVPTSHPHGGRLGRPADFLIASDGRVLACKYGTHAYDQWSVDELLAIVGDLSGATKTSAAPCDYS
jgi:peroxiredoxin